MINSSSHFRYQRAGNICSLCPAEMNANYGSQNLKKQSCRLRKTFRQIQDQMRPCWYNCADGRVITSQTGEAIATSLLLISKNIEFYFFLQCRCLKKEAKSRVYLNKCQLYSLKVYMKDELQFKCLSVGMSGHTFVKEEPIQGNQLYAMPPGK